MTNKIDNQQRGNTLVVTVAVVATILALLGSAIRYTEHISRNSQRSRKTALAMEIADGHLEYLYTCWRNIYRSTRLSYDAGGTDYSLLATNYFYTELYNPNTGCPNCPAPSPVPFMSPSPAPTPPQIPLPAKSNFPTEANYNITQYRIQAVDPMISLCGDNTIPCASPGPNWPYTEDAVKETSFGSANYAFINQATTPPAAYGPNTWQYSYFYLAAVDVSVPTLTGDVKAKVRRVFEKRFDNPWTYAMFYVDDLEFQPSTALTVDGPIHTNASLYVGTSNFTALDRIGYGADYVNGYSPLDGQHSGTPTAPNFVSNLPPAQEAPSLPFGWVLNISTTDQTVNNESYHELIERPVANQTGGDPLAAVRYYNQAGYRVLIDASNTITITNSAGSAITSGVEYNTITGAITTNQPMYDIREGGFVRLATVDISKIDTSKLSSWNGVIYFSDTSAGTSVNSTFNGSNVSTSKRGIRLKNGATLPGNMTVVAENPVYIQGDYNTGGTFNGSTKTYNTPSDNGTFTDPDVSGYTRKGAAVIGDAINVLSGAWNDANSNSSPISQYKVATNTTINAALVGGIVPSGTSSNNYSGGGENFVRFQEDWNKNSSTFTYYGSMVELFKSQQGTGIWQTGGNIYKAPIMHWYYDSNFGTTAPPGKLQIAAYLQQQRWYQVY
jgi:hypothetical protein